MQSTGRPKDSKEAVERGLLIAKVDQIYIQCDRCKQDKPEDQFSLLSFCVGSKICNDCQKELLEG